MIASGNHTFADRLAAKLKFELPRYRYRAVRTDAERAIVTNCQRRLAAGLKFEHERVFFMDHGMKAAELFVNGYNCAQSVVVAFSDVTGLDEKLSAKMVSSFGGGMGRLREVCGAVSGMFFVLGYLYGYDTPGDDESKKALYTEVQALAAQFREQCGSIVCREILKNPPTDPTPSPRTAEYYRVRPCARMVKTAADLMDAFIAEHPLEK